MTTTCQETRICSLCGLPRPLSDYERRKDVASGRRAQCNVCINERRRVCLRRRRDQLTRVALRRAADAKAEGVVLAIANELNRRFHGIEGVGEELERFYLAEHARLQRIVARDSALDGLTPAAYHLAEGEKLNEAINRSWNRPPIP